MPLGQYLILAISVGIGFGITLGLIFRHRLRGCATFAAYVAWVHVTALALLLNPRLDFNWWLFSELSAALLRYLVALELAFYTFRAFPVARLQARRFLSVMTAVVLLLPFVWPTDLVSGEKPWLMHVLPRLYYAVFWVFAGLVVMVLWYRLPMRRLHKAILVGVVPYLLIRILLFQVLNQFGVGQRNIELTNLLNMLAWVAASLVWLWGAWQTEPERLELAPARLDV